MGPDSSDGSGAPRPARHRRNILIALGLANVLLAAAVVVTRHHDQPLKVNTARQQATADPVPEPGDPTPVTDTAPPASTTSSEPATATTAASTSTSRPPAPRPTTTTTTKPAATTPVAIVDQPGLYAVGADGSNLRRLNTAAPGFDPQWSPDGKKIAYLTGNGVTDIHVFDLATGADHKVDGDFSNAYAKLAWSPDSTMLAFPGPGDMPNRDIWVVPADGSAPARQIPAPGDDSVVAWGPSGRLASMSDKGISTFNPDGSDRRPVDSQPLSYGMLEWSPKGDHLLALPVGTDTDLIVDVNGDNPRTLGGGAAGKSSATFGTFSPDGRQIVYAGMVNWKSGAAVAPSDGGPGQIVAEWIAAPTWAPVGDVIAGIDNPENQQYRVIVAFAADGSGRRTLVDLPHNFAVRDRLSWAPDGSALAFTVDPYLGPQNPVPRPVYGTGVKCGEPGGPYGTGVTATSSGDGYSVTVLTPCESPVDQALTLVPEVHHSIGTFTSARIDYGDGTSYNYDSVSSQYSCDSRAPDPWYGNSPAHTYAAPGQYTVRFTVHLTSCDPTRPLNKDVTVSVTIFKT